MLAKLFHHEFKNTAKVMLLLYALTGIITAMSISVSFFDDTFSSLSPSMQSLLAALFGTMIAVYVLSLFALFVLTIVYLCIHFYKTMYSDQGYLTHTLPVSPVATFNVKLVTALVWVLGAVIVIFLSVFVLLIALSDGSFLTELGEIIPELMREIDESGITPLTLLWYLFMTLITNCLSSILMIYACLSVGQLFPHKIAAAILTGICVYFVRRMITGIFTFTVMIDWLENLWWEGPGQLTALFWMFNGLTIFFAAVFYGTCVVIVQKHINLD